MITNKQVLNVIKDYEQASIKQIMIELDATYSSIEWHIRTLEKRRKIEKTSYKARKYAKFQLTNQKKLNYFNYFEF